MREKERIRYLRQQVKLMREMIVLMDKDMAGITKSKTPKLPSFIFEEF